MRNKTTSGPRPVVVGIAPLAQPGYLLRWAAAESQRREVPLRLVQAAELPAAVPMMGISGPYGADAAAQRHLDGLTGWVRREYPGLPVTAEFRTGTPLAVLSAQAADAGLLVVGRYERGRLTRMVNGSTAANLTGVTGCPVVAVPDRSGPASGPIVVGAKDGGPDVLPALRFAMRAAALTGAPVHVMHYTGHGAADGDQHSALAAAVSACRAEQAGVAAHLFILDGDPAELLARESAQSSLLVLAATHGRQHSRPGRIGTAVLRHAACPVALVPAAAGLRTPDGTAAALAAGNAGH